jgi:phosphoserine phosphatase
MKHLYIDLDDTLLPFDSFPYFLAAFLTRRPLKSLPFLLQLPRMSLPGQRRHLRPALAKIMTGEDTAPVDAWCRHWVQKRLLPHVRRNLLPQVSFSICSMSLDIVVKALATTLGGEGLGTVLERSNGRFTGKLQGPQLNGAGKKKIILEDAKRRGLHIEQCGLLTDHHRDIEALESVGFPLAINPSDPLKIWCRKNNIIILDVREKIAY